MKWLKEHSSLVVVSLILAAVGVMVFYPDNIQQIGQSERDSTYLTYYSDNLSVSNNLAFPQLNHFEGDGNGSTHLVWTSFNYDSIRFVASVPDTTKSLELMLADLDNKEVFYQLIVDIKEDTVDYYKYVGGIWIVDNKYVRRSDSNRVIWKNVDKIQISVDEGIVSVTIPWGVMSGVDSNDNLGVQIIRNENDGSRYVDSIPTKTSVLDRDIWNSLNFNQ